MPPIISRRLVIALPNTANKPNSFLSSLGPGAVLRKLRSAWYHFFPVKIQVLQF
jgi:hypothetical protein